jgi:hypothetical protein
MKKHFLISLLILLAVTLEGAFSQTPVPADSLKNEYNPKRVKLAFMGFGTRIIRSRRFIFSTTIASGCRWTRWGMV